MWKKFDKTEPDFSGSDLEYAVWDAFGKTCYGMRKVLTKKRHGIVRTLEPNGAIFEASYKDGQLHGYYIRVDEDGVRM